MSDATLPSGFAMNPAQRTILLVTALLLLPFALAFGLYWFEWRPARLSNHGELIQPPLALPATSLLRAPGAPLPTSELHGKWTLVLVNIGRCSADCQEDLRRMRQVQVAQNKEMGRLRRLLVVGSPTDLNDDPLLPGLRSHYPDLTIATPAAGADGDAWRSPSGNAMSRYYIVDPLGNVMMRYGTNPNMQGMRKDLERLLKYSWVG